MLQPDQINCAKKRAEAALKKGQQQGTFDCWRDGCKAMYAIRRRNVENAYKNSIGKTSCEELRTPKPLPENPNAL